MAIRLIRKEPDEVLRKTSREVTVFDERLGQLLDDMFDTMYETMGVGLAAPQVGVLKRIVVIDVDDNPILMINPKILERRGEQECVEGCLSSPGQYGMIHRPAIVKLQAQNRNGKFFIITVEGLAAQCVDHECDHLDGILFKTKVDRMLAPDEIAQ